MTTLSVNVAAAGPEGPVVLLAGEVVPEWAEGLIGDHALVAEPETERPESGPRRNRNR